MARADLSNSRVSRARSRDESRLDSPKGLSRRFGFQWQSKDRFGRFTEAIARGMGTPAFLFALLLFVILWMSYTAFAPHDWPKVDSVANGFTVLTLALSIQASAGTPLILLAQNRQDDRDRVQIEQDRQRAERNLNDTEYLAREIVALRLAMRDMATKDFIRAELKAMLEELEKPDKEESPVD
ncbi:DUF1003 domain-containing protein [Galbitalea sp. SE-J8]|uniref:DUF1003 domain-containing protein n=1 Tax=Galbitalea sp. SE-J8 TaxID=3054952 RepID=UPI00259C7579|nr:DUF1003 domain-containing protein [Galbitalea sp. SE-J8]MDM4764233.1 DUF1003 domain-containing protein [Galbitalea sp. SE-J8]